MEEEMALSCKLTLLVDGIIAEGNLSGSTYYYY